MDNLNQAANLAFEGISRALNAASAMSIANTKRNALAVTLLRASMDHARAIALLIAAHPGEYGAPSVALCRAQVETLLRGAFFAKEATDDEVDYFVKHDEMPQRPGPDGKVKKLNPRALVQLVDDALAMDGSQKLAGYVDKSWDLLCGLVHGGMGTVMAYHNAEVAFQLEQEDYVGVVSNALAMAQLAMVGIAKLSSTDKQQLSDIFQEPHQAQKKYHEFVIENFKTTTAHD